MSKSKDNNLALENLTGFEWGGYERRTLIPTGYPELDYYVARGLMDNEEFGKFDEGKSGGIPLGCICMIYGGQGGGKSSIAYRICGYAQRMGITPVWFDVENSFSEGLAKINGVDLPRIGRMRMYDADNPEKVFYAEQTLDQVINALKAGAGVIVIDSIAALVTKRQLETPSEQQSMAPLASVLAETIPIIGSLAAANNSLVIAINQLREKPGVMFGNPETTKGGKTLPHHSSIVMKVNKLTNRDSYRYVENDEGEQELIAGSANIRLEKNRFSMPYNDPINIPIYYKPYFPDIEETIFNAGRQTKVISKRKNVFSWGELKVEGRREFISKISEMDYIPLVEDIKNQSKEKGIPLPPEILNIESHKRFEEANNDNVQDSAEEEHDPDTSNRTTKKTSKKKSKKKSSKKISKKPSVENQNIQSDPDV